VPAPAPPPPAVPAPAPAGTPKSIFEDFQVFISGVREHLSASSGPSWAEFEQLMERVIASLEESAELFWLANAPGVPAGADYLVIHQTRVAILAARIGLNVGYDRPRAIALGMAGGVIDVALWQAPDGLLRRLDALTADEQAVYRSHPQRAATLLTHWGAPDGLIEAVLQHHEREQGQGFPQHLSGGAISQDAKILGLIDAYTGLTLPASRKPGLRPHEAIREIVRSKHESFSPALIKALLSEISVFPPGTLVRLNTGEVGQVTAVNRNHPLRPRVEVVSDSKGNKPMAAKTIDLSETPFLYITGPVSESAK
jgi:HD-GYP domain-containing protein (c-di-GMP phosphodiesterase class II)